MEAAGIGVGLHYPVPIHLQPAYADLAYTHGDFPEAEYNASHGLSLPIFPEISLEQIDYVCAALRTSVDEIVAERGTDAAFKPWPSEG
jgi:dTDP-4-amino-4,6-dideoxygalactose transaminase